MIIIALLLILLGCTTLTYMIGVQVGKVIGRQAILTQIPPATRHRHGPYTY